MGKRLGLASFVAGMGAGYLKAKDREYDRERTAKDDAWKEEQRSRQRTEWQDADNLKSDLRSAANPVSTGAVVTDDAGSSAFTKDTDAAAMMADMSNTKNTGMGLQRATRVANAVYTDPAKATEAASLAAKPEAYNQRMAQALRANGEVERASKLEASDMEAQAKRLGFDMDQMKFADEMTNRQMSQALAAGPTWYEGAAKFITDSQYPGIKEMKAEAVLSPDGKTVSMFAAMPDGSKKLAGTYPADDAGQQQFMEKFAKIPLDKRMAIMHEREKSQMALANSKELEGIKHKNAISLEGVKSGNTIREIGVRAGAEGGAKPLSSMDRMLIDGRRAEAKKVVDAIQEKLDDRVLSIQAQKPGPAQDRYNALKAQLAEAQADYQRWDGAMTELATAAAGRAGLGGGNAPAKPAGSEAGLKQQASGVMGATVEARDREISLARADLEKTKDPAERKLLQDHIAQMETQNGKYGGKPVRVTNKAEHAALPKGTRYTAPDGSVRIKQ